MRRRPTLAAILLAAALLRPLASAQETPQATTEVTVGQKWQLFKEETVSPFTLAASGAFAAIAQVTRSDPQYGVGGWAFAERFGAAMGDNISQNVFTDFAMASLFHQDTRYRRRGETHGFWSRFGYAVSRAFVTRTDAGWPTVNWSNLVGCGLQAGLSNAYYPRPSRTATATAINWSNSIVASGFGNLGPEFLPDFKRWLKRHRL